VDSVGKDEEAISVPVALGTTVMLCKLVGSGHNSAYSAFFPFLFLFCFFVVLGVELRALSLLGRHLALETHLQPFSVSFYIVNTLWKDQSPMDRTDL
jgi:hypothetical protein